MATCEGCCHLTGGMLNLAAEAADRARMDTAPLTQSAVLTQSGSLTQSALLMQSMPVLLGSSGEGLPSSDLTPHDNLNTDGHDPHFITRFLRRTRDTTPTDGGSLVTLDNTGDHLNINHSFGPSIHPHPARLLGWGTRRRKYL
jgi:hypothetical protein